MIQVQESADLFGYLPVPRQFIAKRADRAAPSRTGRAETTELASNSKIVPQCATSCEMLQDGQVSQTGVELIGATSLRGYEFGEIAISGRRRMRRTFPRFCSNRIVAGENHRRLAEASRGREGRNRSLRPSRKWLNLVQA